MYSEINSSKGHTAAWRISIWSTLAFAVGCHFVTVPVNFKSIFTSLSTFMNMKLGSLTPQFTKGTEKLPEAEK